jgi:hypothetical protein
MTHGRCFAAPESLNSSLDYCRRTLPWVCVVSYRSRSQENDRGMTRSSRGPNRSDISIYVGPIELFTCTDRGCSSNRHIVVSAGRFPRRDTGMAPCTRVSSTARSRACQSLLGTHYAWCPCQQRPRCEAAESSISWVPVSFIGILYSVDDSASRRHHRSPALAIKPAGRIPKPPHASLRPAE